MTHKYSESTEQIDVAYVAHLARMHLSEEEITTFQAQLQQVLGYVDQLKSLDVEHIEPTAHAVPVQNVFRKDETRPSLDLEKAIGNAPQSRNGCFVVPKIIE